MRWLAGCCRQPFSEMAYTKPERARMAIEELGTTFVKLGQILSTRADLLPRNIPKSYQNSKVL